MMFLFQGTPVSHKLLDNLPVHERFTAEEIDLQIRTVTGICHQKIQCFLSDLVAHDRSSAVVFTFFRKAVSAGKVTVMRNMQAKCLDNRFAVFKAVNIIFVNVLCIQLSFLCKQQNLIHRLGSLFFRIRKLLRFHEVQNLSLVFLFFYKGLQQRNKLVNKVIHNMHSTAVDIHHDGITIALITMNHYYFLSVS